MSTIELLAGLGTLAFLGVFLGCTLVASGGLSLERRAEMLERRDPGSAEALRRAQAWHDRAYLGLFGDEAFPFVCTPSRRSALDMARVRGTDADLRVEPPEEVLPPVPATVVALNEHTHVARTAARHRATGAGATTRRAARRDPATSRPRADSR